MKPRAVEWVAAPFTASLLVVYCLLASSPTAITGVIDPHSSVAAELGPNIAWDTPALE
jgi:hypothetical protein